MMPATSQKTPIGIDRIRELVPHAGTMCLLDRVVEFSVDSIRCETDSHTDPGNPLRRNGHLSGICAIEYAAQAMALHAALGSAGAATARATNPDPAHHGYLVSVRDIRCHIRRLDCVTSTLEVCADRIYGDAAGLIYTFAVTAARTALVTGRASVVPGSASR